MLTTEDNDTVTRVARGTPMGNLMRQFWIPACLSRELEPGAAPMRLVLLGERLVAFRDGEGRTAIMDHRCPHRGVSLFFGRVENDGIRCVYHGWKFDARGQCQDIPNAEMDPSFIATMSTRAYPTRERNGVVWVYMGERRELPPELPLMEALTLDDAEISVRCLQRKYNWLQGLEGDIDTSHFGFLHLGSIAPDDVDAESMHRFAVIDRAPRYHVTNSHWGTTYCAYRPADEGNVYYRFAHFVMPFWTLYPDGDFRDHIVAQAWVPMDDEHTMVFSFVYKQRAMALRHLKDGTPIPGLEPDAGSNPTPAMKPNTSDWFGRWQTEAEAGNDYFIDRDVQATSSYSGISSVVMQDLAIIESMGTVSDRSTEHLVSSDAMVARTRRLLLASARAFASEGKLPKVVDEPAVCLAARSGSFVASGDRSWKAAYAQEVGRAVSPRDTLKGAVEKFTGALG